MRGFSGIFGGFLPGIWPKMVGNGLFRLGESSWISFGPSCWFSGRFWRFLFFLIFGIFGILGFFEKWIFGGRYGFREAFQEIRNEISLPGTSGRPQNHYYRPFLWRKGWDDDGDDTTRQQWNTWTQSAPILFALRDEIPREDIPSLRFLLAVFLFQAWDLSTVALVRTLNARCIMK